jgi:hypothetical protein
LTGFMLTIVSPVAPPLPEWATEENMMQLDTRIAQFLGDLQAAPWPLDVNNPNHEAILDYWDLWPDDENEIIPIPWRTGVRREMTRLGHLILGNDDTPEEEGACQIYAVIHLFWANDILVTTPDWNPLEPDVHLDPLATLPAHVQNTFPPTVAELWQLHGFEAANWVQTLRQSAADAAAWQA